MDHFIGLKIQNYDRRTLLICRNEAVWDQFECLPLGLTFPLFDKICVQICCERLSANQPIATAALDDIVYQAEVRINEIRYSSRHGFRKVRPYQAVPEGGTGTPPPHEGTNRDKSAAA